MKKIMLLTKNQELINKLEESHKNKNIILTYDDFMTIFEQLNFHNPDAIIFDFNLIDYTKQFMLESLPKKNEPSYIKLVAIGECPIKEKMADFYLKITENSNIDELKVS